MKKHIFSVFAFALMVALLGAGCQIVPVEEGQQQPTPNPTPTTPPTSNETQQVSVALIVVGNPGTGIAIGCGDSVQRVTVQIPKTTAPLGASLVELLKIKDQYYGQSGLYNALYQSDLSLESVSIDANATAHIRLKGTMKLGGVCDMPRVKAQIHDTAIQFESVKKTNILVNDKPIDDVLSLQ